MTNLAISHHQMDSFLRYAEYKVGWQDGANQKYAAQVHALLMPAYEERQGKPGGWTRIEAKAKDEGKVESDKKKGWWSR
jgi:hypothetical protein